MPRKRATEEDEKKEDAFISKLQAAMEKLLDSGLEPKDMNALFANAIKFLAVKHKIEGQADGGSFFGDD